jgi:hypothetical protein
VRLSLRSLRSVQIREQLASDRLRIGRSEEARRQRELKKMGKEIQRKVLDERNKRKKNELEVIKRLRKGVFERAHVTMMWIFSHEL